VSRLVDRIYIAPDEDHWYGATPTGLMVRLAINETDDRYPAAIWGEHVPDEEYLPSE
jgi:hypothetical protein